MKILKSIKWRLQLWYGLILVVVLVGFGVTAYQLERSRHFRRVDDELHRRLGAVMQALRVPPRRPPQGRQLRDDFPPRQSPDGVVVDGGNSPKGFTLPPPVAALFDTNQIAGYYLVLNTPDGHELMRLGEVPSHVAFDVVGNGLSRANYNRGPDGLWKKPPSAWTVERFREVFQATPAGDNILVGCSLQSEMRELNRTALTLFVVGSGILLLGLAGGWWLVVRAMRPVSEISSTAAKISAGDLSHRINVAETESELGELAAVLNSTFARLETAFAQQKQFASDAAHELRTPVTVILTQTQMALARERDASAYKQAVETCQRAAQRMRRLIESLLELARFDAGQEVLKRLRFDLSETVADSLDLVQTLAAEKQVKISSQLESLEIDGDPERLSQVVANLLTNAIQYNKSGGEVRVKLQISDGLAILEISDDGQGIAPEDLPRVFERFYRADKSRTGNGNSGLGLAICKAIVEAHGGTIEAASSSGNGSVFIVRLPL